MFIALEEKGRFQFPLSLEPLALVETEKAPSALQAKPNENMRK